MVPLDIEVACYGYEGIDAVKEALRAGLSCSTESMPIKVSGITDVGSALTVGVCYLTVQFCCSLVTSGDSWKSGSWKR